MRPEDAHTLLDRIDALRHPCDLDLLMFFVKHPHTLLASEQLAAFMAYDIEQLAQSLDVLLEAGLVTRSQNPTQAARMHVFAGAGPLEDGCRLS
jgi:DNA-binding MarR family transcriptional regulator